MQATHQSALAFRVSAALPSAVGDEPTLILVPGAPGSDQSLLQAIREAGWAGETISLLPPRAVFYGIEHRGYCWFHRVEPEVIEPTSFGDSLWQLERFVLDRLQDAPTGNAVVLIGVDDGAALVLAATPYLHDRIAAAIAINGYLPSASWWAPPRANLGRLPILLIRSGDEDGENQRNASDWLKERGARVDRTEHLNTEPLHALRVALQSWLGVNRVDTNRSANAGSG